MATRKNNDIPVDITWSLVEIDKSQIKRNPDNPKIENAKGKRNLEKITKKYGVIFDGIINADNSLIDGHSRLELYPTGVGRFFKPSRQLSKKDYQELNALFDFVRAGDPDIMAIEKLFSEETLNEWDMLNEKKPPKKIEEENLRPFVKTHVLLSFPPDKLPQLAPHLEAIKKIKGVEYEQASN